MSNEHFAPEWQEIRTTIREAIEAYRKDVSGEFDDAYLADAGNRCADRIASALGMPTSAGEEEEEGEFHAAWQAIFIPIRLALRDYRKFCQTLGASPEIVDEAQTALERIANMRARKRTPIVGGRDQQLFALADAIDEARYRSPQNVRTRPRPFVQADPTDLEYCFRLAIAVQPLVQQPLLDALRLFREFVEQNATQWKLGSNHHHPIWGLVADALGTQNGRLTTPEEWQTYVHIAGNPAVKMPPGKGLGRLGIGAKEED